MFHRMYSGAPQSPMGKTTHLHHRRWLKLCTACPLIRMKFRSVTCFGTVAELHYLGICMKTVLCYSSIL